MFKIVNLAAVLFFSDCLVPLQILFFCVSFPILVSPLFFFALISMFPHLSPSLPRCFWVHLIAFLAPSQPLHDVSRSQLSFPPFLSPLFLSSVGGTLTGGVACWSSWVWSAVSRPASQLWLAVISSSALLFPTVKHGAPDDPTHSPLPLCRLPAVGVRRGFTERTESHREGGWWYLPHLFAWNA